VNIGNKIYKKSSQELREFYEFYRYEVPSEIFNFFKPNHDFIEFHDESHKLCKISEEACRCSSGGVAK